ncbi:MAG: hypothetical protein L0Z55_02425 [Planctomycetes bacterium]|nr:hypothetical protein [Planctomycetota bacterium]
MQSEAAAWRSASCLRRLLAPETKGPQARRPRSARASWLLILLIAAPACAGPVRIVRVPASERAARQLTAARAAEEAGRPREALEFYRAALARDRSCAEAWYARLDLAPEAERPAIEEELRSWEESAPAEALPCFLRGKLAEIGGGDGTLAFRRAWERSDGAYLPLIDPLQATPQGAAGWRRYRDLLAALEPRSAEIEFRFLATLWELGEIERLEAELPHRALSALDRAFFDAAVLAGRGEMLRALELGLVGPGRGDRPRPEELRLQLEILGSLDRRAEAERTLARGRALFPDERLWTAERARLLLLAGSRAEAERVLDEGAGDVVFPRGRIGAAVMRFDLTLARGGGGSRALRDAIPWCVSPGETNLLFLRFLQAQDPEGCGACLAANAALEPESQAADAWRRDAAMLARLREAPHLLPEAWNFLRVGDPTAQRAAFGSIPRSKRAATLRIALAHAEAAPRILALQLLQGERLLAFSELPPDLGSDRDPRVRGAWVALAAADGSDEARAAVRAALHDPDPYVREIAARGESRDRGEEPAAD